MTKHAIVAGVGPGVGLAIAKRFSREGYAVSLIARDSRSLAAYENTISHQGAKAKGYPADLCELSQVKTAFEQALADQGEADVLVYNAARWHTRPAMQLDPMTFNWDIALCATGALACAQHVYPAMKGRGCGSMLFTGGGLALYPQTGAGVASLTAGKSALRGLVFALAGELKPDNIHVATVTIAGQVAAGTAFDPDIIADHYWRLHVQPNEAWEIEYVFRG